MPIVIIETVEGRSIDEKRGLVKDVTAAICKNFTIPPEHVRIIFHEDRKDNLATAGKLAIDS